MVEGDLDRLIHIEMRPKVRASFTTHAPLALLFLRTGSRRPSTSLYSYGPLHLYTYMAVPTHWKQTALYLETPALVSEGDRISGSLKFARSEKYSRAYEITVDYAVNTAHVGSQTFAMA